MLKTCRGRRCKVTHYSALPTKRSHPLDPNRWWKSITSWVHILNEKQKIDLGFLLWKRRKSWVYPSIHATLSPDPSVFSVNNLWAYPCSHSHVHYLCMLGRPIHLLFSCILRQQRCIPFDRVHQIDLWKEEKPHYYFGLGPHCYLLGLTGLH